MHAFSARCCEGLIVRYSSVTPNWHGADIDVVRELYTPAHQHQSLA